MARQPRQLEDGAAYHVTCQVNREEHRLKEPMFKEKYLEILERGSGKYFCEIRNFCIMDNHVHLEIYPKLPKEYDLSRCMQWISGMFTRAYNKMTGESGRLWRGRFKSRIITDEKYERTLFEYISYNYSRVDPEIKPGDYKYCGMYHIIRKDFRIIEKPDPERQAFIEEIHRKSEDPMYYESQLKANRECGFYPGKPGRKPKEKKSA